MNIRYIDTHCHLQFPQFASDREELIEKMYREGVVGIVVGTNVETSREAIALAGKYEHIYATTGIHPHHVQDVGHAMSNIHELVRHPKVVAIGECGLDFFRDGADEKAIQEQERLFQEHIDFAAELGKPLIIHSRSGNGINAYKRVINILEAAKAECPILCGTAHFFAGSLKDAEEFVELGFSVSFTAVITFSRSYDDIIRALPLERILPETDAPYVAPADRRGERNDPLAVIEVSDKIAEIRNEDRGIVRATLLKNARLVFDLKEC